MSASDSIARAAAFVRGFFLHLEAQGITNAVLHGGEGGFERALSDVDFVVARGSFESLPSLIDSYCDSCGWWLCQILRHETTAAYFVCSAADDPTCAVALDACSDYQRNGTVYLTAEELLENTLALDWGGHRLSPANQLCYRFAKASAKNKNPEQASEEFSGFPEEIRRVCAEWLETRWTIGIRGWDAHRLSAAMADLRVRSNQRPTPWQKGAIKRILSRITRPSGLVVIAGHTEFDTLAEQMKSTLGNLYFRRFRKSHHWHFGMLKDLVSTTLIVVPSLPRIWRALLPASCVRAFGPGYDAETCCHAITNFLHQRCKEN